MAASSIVWTIIPGDRVSGLWEASGSPYPDEGEITVPAWDPLTTISLTLPDASQVHLAVYDLLGRQMALLVNGYRKAGLHDVTFDAGDLPWGVHFYRIGAGNYSEVRKMVLMK